MKLFLASSLCFVSDVIFEHISLEWKSVWCIRNAATQWWGKDAYWNVWDRDFFLENWAELMDIDLEELEHGTISSIIDSVDILFCWWGDTVKLARLLEQQGVRDILEKNDTRGLVYMWTSAGAMVASDMIHYKHEWNYQQWLWLIDMNIIPHRSSPSFKHDRIEWGSEFYDFPYPSLLLTDIDVLVAEDRKYTIERSKKHTLEEVFAKVASEEK